ncbi:Heme oxygenase [Klebsormidium nitens]|uniref:heme oxygenase (biliverdin-producing) n=1 Tax=Klebsormidium nitens TaxID=105231 RepID=A0A1Y1HM15_KLENI|nr:Heme oxygenase [Klebsormidium nitens]|eukprot:GAQ79033.1 Heme oxygenase [Klebsormidium nitens]
MATSSLQGRCLRAHVAFRAPRSSEAQNLKQNWTLCLRNRAYPGHRSLLSKAQPSKLNQGRCIQLQRKIVAQAVESSTAAPQSETPAAENGAEEKKGRRRPGEAKGFVEEMRIKAMKLHTRGQAKDGEAQEKETQQKPLPQWKPTVEGYIQFLVDSKAVYDTMEAIVDKAPHQSYAEFRNTGLERTGPLSKDLEHFRSEGYSIPEPTEAGLTYSKLLEELSESNPQAFICHFYNVYFAHSAGGRMIGRKVSEMILEGRELEFYKWDGELSELLDKVKLKINEVSNDWTREEKDKCLQETELSFKYSGSLLKLLANT